MAKETILTMSSANIKYGFGATREVGFDMKELDATRVMVVTDQRLADKEPVRIIQEALKKEKIDAAHNHG